MAAKIEVMLERLDVIIKEIKDLEAKGQPCDNLVEESKTLRLQLKQARELLTESHGKVIRG